MQDIHYTGKTLTIIDYKDVTRIKCHTKPACESFRNSFLYSFIEPWTYEGFPVLYILHTLYVIIIMMCNVCNI